VTFPLGRFSPEGIRDVGREAGGWPASGPWVALSSLGTLLVGAQGTALRRPFYRAREEKERAAPAAEFNGLSKLAGTDLCWSRCRCPWPHAGHEVVCGCTAESGRSAAAIRGSVLQQRRPI